AYVDCTGVERLFGDGPTIAGHIRSEIRAQTQLTASVGVAPNKFLAKLASDMNKPDGLTVLTQHEIDTLLPTLPVGRIRGIGQKTVERLTSAGVRTIGDLRKMDGEFLKRRFGALAERVARLIHGIDDRPVVPDHDAKSIGQEQTFGENLTDLDELRAVLLSQSEQVGRRLRRARRLARVVTVKIRYGDFETITRRCTLENATDLDVDLYRTACALFDEWVRRSFSSVRLIGMSCSELTDQQQLDLFDGSRVEKQRKIDAALDAIKNRFGSSSIHRGQGGGRVRE
ncbi:MAG TPA: DNA polymerase IV, partial [Tepidisphaeraceae bacterium]|nr:DNA polymerase IV [Tepidisphaeraceae bacterium]